MKKSNENTKRKQETNQIADTKTRTVVEETPHNTKTSFLGRLFQRFVCSPNPSLPDDKSEIVFIPKASSK